MRVLHLNPAARAVASPARFERGPAYDIGDSAKRGVFGVLAEWARAEKIAATANYNASPIEVRHEHSVPITSARGGHHAGAGSMTRLVGDHAGYSDVITYDHHSANSANLFCASTAMWVLEKALGLRQPVGAPAHRGIAVESGVTHGLMNPDASLAECVRIAIVKYDTLMALSPDTRREKYRETLSDMVRQALAELRPYGVPSGVQGRVEWKPDGLRLPVIGFYDFEWSQHGIIVDLKTTEKLPLQIKVSHARQAAFYASSNNMAARVTYVTPKKCETYELENIREHREALRQIAMRIENFLALSDDPEFFKSITVPDLESFYWRAPAARQLAFEHWGV